MCLWRQNIVFRKNPFDATTATDATGKRELESISKEATITNLCQIIRSKDIFLPWNKNRHSEFYAIPLLCLLFEERDIIYLNYGVCVPSLSLSLFLHFYLAGCIYLSILFLSSRFTRSILPTTNLPMRYFPPQSSSLFFRYSIYICYVPSSI